MWEGRGSPLAPADVAGLQRVTQSHVLAFLIEGARIRELNAFLNSVRV